MWQWIEKGGPVMIPIILCSVVTLTIIVERFIFYHSRIRFDTQALLEKILGYVRKNRITEAIDLCEKNPYYVTNILKAGLLHHEDSRDIVKDAMENVSLYEIPKLEQNISFLGAIASLAPLLGFLGTAVGFLRCFYVIEKKLGIATFADLSMGIWEALVTTVFGLCVAIFSYSAYRYFLHRVGLYMLDAQRAESELLEVLAQRKYVNEV
ncbi:MAG: MotA/TolQ/ExbB proton channel family protein [Candidatus Omnitrophota bacterium]